MAATTAHAGAPMGRARAVRPGLHGVARRSVTGRPRSSRGRVLRGRGSGHGYRDQKQQRARNPRCTASSGFLTRHTDSSTERFGAVETDIMRREMLDEYRTAIPTGCPTSAVVETGCQRDSSGRGSVRAPTRVVGRSRHPRDASRTRTPDSTQGAMASPNLRVCRFSVSLSNMYTSQLARSV
jgi:hypothetical protein